MLDIHFGKGKVRQRFIQSRGYIHISATDDAGNSVLHDPFLRIF
jgi:hypothetical protein